MPARDVYHHVVVRALVADGWVITHDPLSLSYGGRDLYVDLGAEDVTVGAARHGCQIAVEIKSFLSTSVLADLDGRSASTRSTPRCFERSSRPARSTSRCRSACSTAS